MCATIPFFGWLSDRLGRTKVFAWGAVISGFAAFPAFWVFVTHPRGHPGDLVRDHHPLRDLLRRDLWAGGSPVLGIVLGAGTLYGHLVRVPILRDLRERPDADHRHGPAAVFRPHQSVARLRLLRPIGRRECPVGDVDCPDSPSSSSGRDAPATLGRQRPSPGRLRMRLAVGSPGRQTRQRFEEVPMNQAPTRRGILAGGGLALAASGLGLRPASAEEVVQLPFGNGERPLVAYPGKRPLLQMTARPPRWRHPLRSSITARSPERRLLRALPPRGHPDPDRPAAFRVEIGGQVERPSPCRSPT